jgi:gluconolactonase
VLADKFEGKRLNAPNDIVVNSDDSIWFTDPLFGINGEWEGKKEKPEQATTNVYRLTKDGKLSAVITDIVNPNGLAFSPDEKKLYVVEWKGTPNRSIWSFDVNADGTVGGKTKLIDAADQGALDGFRVDRNGRIWTSSAEGVHCYDADGSLIGKILIPELVANVTFGGAKLNRLFICGTTSLYSIYVTANGSKLG